MRLLTPAHSPSCPITSRIISTTLILLILQLSSLSSGLNLDQIHRRSARSSADDDGAAQSAPEEVIETVYPAANPMAKRSEEESYIRFGKRGGGGMDDEASDQQHFEVRAVYRTVSAKQTKTLVYMVGWLVGFYFPFSLYNTKLYNATVDKCWLRAP